MRTGFRDPVDEERQGRPQEVKVNVSHHKKKDDSSGEKRNKRGYSQHRSGQSCPAAEAKCKGCGKKGHFNYVRRSASSKKNNSKGSSKSKRVEVTNVEVRATQVHVAKLEERDFSGITLDSGAGSHVVNNRASFEKWEEKFAIVTTANGGKVRSPRQCAVRVLLPGAHLMLRNVRSASLNFNVISTSALKGKELDFWFPHNGDVEIQFRGIFIGACHSGQFSVRGIAA